ncbi:MAG: hypothetical protein EOQ28_14810 [Mesorhizobium sp.]|uniref:hypothetical protein n=1 Tax=Mesorhizobium sp. TaxID=1871066 RepID=UPI000FE6640E|nr:hypothetical protein [Mesorhizobium sp.]RWA73411.1 MAG: hypothetical protein EOQ28_14810 [Mesorhizobium sp.]
MRNWTLREREMMDSMLECYRQRWTDDGDVGAIGEAVAFCGLNSYPLPEWCVEPVWGALAVFNETGARGQGTPRSRLTDLQKARQRHGLVKLYMQLRRKPNGKPITLQAACEQVANQLKHHNVTARAVLESYRQIEKETPKSPI